MTRRDDPTDGQNPSGSDDRARPEDDARAALERWRASGSFVLDLDIASVLVDGSRCLLRAPLSPEVTTRHGAAALGLTVSLLDIAASEPALAACRPDWTATQDLSVHATSRVTEGPVVIDARLVRAGRKTITMAANVYDGHGLEDFDALQRAIDEAALQPGAPTLAAKALLTFVRIPGASVDGMDDYDPAKWIGRVRRRKSDAPLPGSLATRMGAVVLNAEHGVVELASHRYVSNSIGTIFGGAQAALLQIAAESMRPDLEATDMQVHYLSAVKVGPARTVGSVSRDAGDHSVVSLQLVDAGYREQTVALATVLLQRPPSRPHG